MGLNKIKIKIKINILKFPIQSSSGFAMMEVMIAVALLALLSYGVMELLRVQQRGTLSARITSSRDQIVSQLARTVGDPRALQATAAHSANIAFNECVIEGPVAVDCDQNVTPLTLLDASGRVIAGPGGGSPTPVIYDEMGAICPGLTSPSASCPFIVTATFNANCGGPVTCTLARMVRVEYIVQTSLVSVRAGGALRTVSGDATSGVPLWATNPVGVVNFIPKWGSTTELVTSVIYEDPLGKNIGIGTTNPQSALAVSGDITAGDPVQAENIRNTVYGTNIGTIVSAFGTGYAVAIGQNNANESGIGISNLNNPVGSFYYSPLNPPINANDNSVILHSYGERSIHLVTERNVPNGGILALTVLGSNNILTNGNIGINQTNPTARLHVNGDERVDGNEVVNGNALITGNLLVNGSITSGVNLIAPNIIGNVTMTGNLILNPPGNITAAGNITAGGFVMASDRRLKKNFEPIVNPLEKILSLEGLYYDWKDKKRGVDRQIGLIAQDTELIFPEAVETDAKGIKGINYGTLIAPLIEALREEVQKTKTLEEKIKQLEQRLEKLESK